MPVWSVTFTNDSPHFSAALVEAETLADAWDLLEAHLAGPARDESGGFKNDTIWEDHVLPRSKWAGHLVDGPVLFLLGSGCR